ncbi:transglycosylase SLT domain-containing protein [Nocardia miyunensis]|uniref:lytic transglycosylase domain-containing protein n=1 Tax=Nocardia miyunensis TaxID=282684 RepID=UPI00082E1B49|nr:transglycosylase SLT domain-containing protein [Nocardia miyunensis]
MTLTISNVEAWNPAAITTAGTAVGTTSTSLDKALGDADHTINNLTWDGNAAKAARTRMGTEKTRASAVSGALLELQKALSTHVENLTNTRKAVLDAREPALHPTGKEATPPDPFEVADNGVVTATKRKDYIDKLQGLNDGEKTWQKCFQDLLAANHQSKITGALAQAESAATDLITAVNTAKGKVDAAYGGLGDPKLGTTAPAPAAPTATSPAAVTSNTSTPHYQTTSHSSHSGNGTSSHNGTSHYSNAAFSDRGGSDANLSKPSGNVAEWIKQAREILIQEGVPADQIDDNAIATIIEHESGGNPSIVNDWDSNAAAGHPSKGLMQTIDSTFNSYAVPGHTDILNPVDNIVAASRYAIHRYGSLSDVPGVVAVRHGGSYVGY